MSADRFGGLQNSRFSGTAQPKSLGAMPASWHTERVAMATGAQQARCGNWGRKT